VQSPKKNEKSEKSDSSPGLQCSLQILENLIYLIKNEVPGSAAQMAYHSAC
jgi:hypothetical protein